MATVLSNETLQDEIAVSVAQILASANRKAKELGVDAQLLAREQDRTFENVFGVKLLSNLVHILRLAFESKRRCSGANGQTINDGQVADDFAGEAVRKVVVVGIPI